MDITQEAVTKKQEEVDRLTTELAASEEIAKSASDAYTAKWKELEAAGIELSKMKVASEEAAKKLDWKQWVVELLKSRPSEALHYRDDIVRIADLAGVIFDGPRNPGVKLEQKKAEHQVNEFLCKLLGDEKRGVHGMVQRPKKGRYQWVGERATPEPIFNHVQAQPLQTAAVSPPPGYVLQTQQGSVTYGTSPRLGTDIEREDLHRYVVDNLVNSGITQSTDELISNFRTEGRKRGLVFQGRHDEFIAYVMSRELRQGTTPSYGGPDLALVSRIANDKHGHKIIERGWHRADLQTPPGWFPGILQRVPSASNGYRPTNGRS